MSRSGDPTRGRAPAPRWTGEGVVRGVLAAILVVVTASGLVTFVQLEPRPWAELLQIAHGFAGLALLLVGAGYAVLHLVQLYGGGGRAWRRFPWLLLVLLVGPFVLSPPTHHELTGPERRVSNLVGGAGALGALAYLAMMAVRAARRGIRSVDVSGGLVLAVSLVVALSGWLTTAGRSAHQARSVHVVASLVALAAAGAHVVASRRAATRGLPTARRPYPWRRPLLVVTAPLAAALGLVLALSIGRLAAGVGALALDTRALRPADVGFAARIPRGCVACHSAVVSTWTASSHAFAARNPVFTALLERVSAGDGPDGVASCLGCHAPGAPDPHTTPLVDVVASEGYASGVHCLTCHRLRVLGDGGDGAFTVVPLSSDRFHFLIDLPGPVADRLRGFTEAASVSVSSRMPLHRRAFATSYTEPASCGPCHRQTLGPATHGRLTDVVQDTYGAWRRSPSAERGVGCAACHMPTFYAPEGYEVSDHRMLGGSTYVARVAGGEEGERATVAHLEGHAPAPAMASPGTWRGRSGGLLELSAELVRRGAAPSLSIRTRGTAGIGHGFPEGPSDLSQTWLAVRVVDGGGRTLVEVGRDSPGRAVTLGRRLFDRDDLPIRDHRVWAVARVEDGGQVLPEAARVDEIALPTAELAVPLTVELTWYYRRFDPELVRELTGTAAAGLPSVAVARLVGTIDWSRRLTSAAASPVP